MNKYCELCNKPHNGEYGSGRFCSEFCAKSFSTKKNREERNKKISKSLTGKKYPNKGNNWTEESSKKCKDTWNKKLLDSPWEKLGITSRRKRVIIEQNNTCNKCKNSTWLGKQIPLELEHIDGNHSNNARDNLEALCPNCHALTKTWRGRNKSKKVSDEELLKALHSSKNIRQALIKVGLSPRGKNYERCHKLLGS